MKKTALYSLLVLAVVTVVPGKAGTSLTDPWADRGFIHNHGPFKGIMIIGVPEQPDKRQQLENAFVKTLSDNGVTALASLDVMSADTEVSEQTVRAALEGKSIDGVLLTRLFRVEEIEEVQGGDPGTKRSERDFAIGLWGDWRNARDFALDAPVKKRHRVVLENNFYDLKTAELIWSVQSYSMDPKSADEVIKSLSGLITKQLKKEKLI